MATPTPTPVPESTTHRRTVAVVDMFGYSDVVRMLEQNLNAGTVADLNRQIQSFINRSLDQIPDRTMFCVIDRPGDGAKVSFHHAEDAHNFAREVHLLAKAHNDTRSLPLAQRWFRIGLATGEVNASPDCDGRMEHAGETIAVASRLEPSAVPGEILIDSFTYTALPSTTQSLYGPEQTIKGKRSELFRGRRFCVTPGFVGILPVHPILTRRNFLLTGTSVAAAGALGVWFERDPIYAMSHPLPAKRFVALMAWPLPSPESEAAMASMIDLVHARLSRAESTIHDLLIVSSQDMAAGNDVASGTAPANAITRNPKAIAQAWGTNLILALDVVKAQSSSTVRLALLDPALNLLRKHDIPIKSSEMAGASTLVSRAAAALLGLPTDNVELSDESELASVSPAARTLYERGKLLASDLNATQDAQAIDYLQQALSIDPKFALAYATLGRVLLRQHDENHDAASLSLAGTNMASALRLNPESERAHIGDIQFRLASGEAKAALEQCDAVLGKNPLCADALLLRGQAFGELHRPHEEEAAYRDLIRTRPNYWLAYNELGSCLQINGNYDEAISCFEKASRLSPGSVLPLNNLGLLYLDQSRIEDAASAFNRSNSITPNSAALEYLGNIAYRNKQYAQALSQYRKAEALSPNSYYILSDIGDCYEQLGNAVEHKAAYSKAARILSGQLRLNPTDFALWMLLALYNAITGDREGAKKAMQLSTSLGENLTSLFLQARTLRRLGRTDQAQDTLAKCLGKGLSAEEISLAPEFSPLSHS